ILASHATGMDRGSNRRYVGIGQTSAEPVRDRPRNILGGRMNEFVCNYAIARFRPYRESGELVNVGVALLCPQVDFFGYIFESRKHKRITDFFPELDFEAFKAGLSGLLKELARLAAPGEGASQY